MVKEKGLTQPLFFARDLLALHIGNLLPKGLNLLPIGKLNHGFWVGRAVRHPHDQSDHQSIEKSVTRVIDLAGKHRQLLGLPGNALQEFLQVGIAGRAVFSGFARHHVHREKCIGLAVQNRLILLDEGGNLRTVLAVANAGADDDFIEGRRIGLRDLVDRQHRYLLSGLLNNRLQGTADFFGLAVVAGVNNQNVGHGGFWVLDRRTA